MKLCKGILREKMKGGASHKQTPEIDRAETFKSDTASPPARLKPRLCLRLAENETVAG
ncbi:hypothetical protein [Microcoleus sp. PH2017_40_RAT_O_B]|uniref:hypothetical protein n=1 Tax=Microcoleus sp. PH2017_40_RAT_O_B TaxID=2798850 RepID=UPI0025DDECE1|nr:hypothetical protein [Microcoleus sp. PH2017_40_RAT_O_B]